MEQIKVLLVDDDKIILRNLIRMLDWEQYGFHIVATAFNGKKGIEKFHACKPHIVLTDIKMPIMDGLEMIRTIRATDKNGFFLILTAYQEFDYALEAIRQGANGYLLKGKLDRQSLLDALLPLKEQLISKNKEAYLFVYNMVNSCVSTLHTEMATVLGEIDLAFDSFVESPTSDSFRGFTRQISDLIRKSYEIRGRSNLFIDPGILDTEELRTWLKEQIALLYRWEEEERSNAVTPYISKAKQYIEAHYADSGLSVKQIADTLEISVSWLSVRFKRETGQTLKEYITQVRIEHAKRLLRQGTHKVYQVADLVGFNSSQHFSKVFCSVTGQLPQHYRRDEDA